MFHYLCDDGITFICITDADVDRYLVNHTTVCMIEYELILF